MKLRTVIIIAILIACVSSIATLMAYNFLYLKSLRGMSVSLLYKEDLLRYEEMARRDLKARLPQNETLDDFGIVTYHFNQLHTPNNHFIHFDSNRVDDKRAGASYHSYRIVWGSNTVEYAGYGSFDV